jgi:hypothetical protein
MTNEKPNGLVPLSFWTLELGHWDFSELSALFLGFSFLGTFRDLSLDIDHGAALVLAGHFRCAVAQVRNVRILVESNSRAFQPVVRPGIAAL